MGAFYPKVRHICNSSKASSDADISLALALVLCGTRTMVGALRLRRFVHVLGIVIVPTALALPEVFRIASLHGANLHM